MPGRTLSIMIVKLEVSVPGACAVSVWLPELSCNTTEPKPYSSSWTLPNGVPPSLRATVLLASPETHTVTPKTWLLW